MNLYEKLKTWTLAQLESDKKRYISMLSDYGFKVTFGNEDDTRFLKKAIQLLIKSDIPIEEIYLDRNEISGITELSRGGIFDVSCKDAEGNSFIVEMQLTGYKSFIHRSKLYALHRLNQMFVRGKKLQGKLLKKIYVISFLGGRAFPGKEFYHFCVTKDQHGRLIDDQITHIYIELGKRDMSEKEVITDFDKLIFVMKYTDFATIDHPEPAFFKESWIQDILRKLRLSSLTQEQRFQYEKKLLQEISHIQETEEATHAERLAKEMALVAKEKAIQEAKREKKMRDRAELKAKQEIAARKREIELKKKAELKAKQEIAARKREIELKKKAELKAKQEIAARKREIELKKKAELKAKQEIAARKREIELKKKAELKAKQEIAARKREIELKKKAELKAKQEIAARKREIELKKKAELKAKQEIELKEKAELKAKREATLKEKETAEKNKVQQQLIKTVQSLLALNTFSVEKIAKITGVSLAEIKAIQQKM